MLLSSWFIVIRINHCGIYISMHRFLKVAIKSEACCSMVIQNLPMYGQSLCDLACLSFNPVILVISGLFPSLPSRERFFHDLSSAPAKCTHAHLKEIKGFFLACAGLCVLWAFTSVIWSKNFFDLRSLGTWRIEPSRHRPESRWEKCVCEGGW